ncbi:putative bifunctional diguanylate cyclase/phosphodiesterase [Pseudonocardia abyssalis]|uniref:putative bifunctional diguanylate cyclase/phosphodiesterase n=1 Tax=Pseudonocardia abyssalis TaxID=2792008 RepID=UPI001CF618F5|nr:bifunctional diguanylate cyclase/phosphodiesterase [Pseudonocardia abyssalis]
MDAEALARSWGQAVRGTSHVALSRSELDVLLRGLSERLLRALRTPELDRADVMAAGRELVGAHFTEIASLDRTLEHLGTHLQPHAEPGRLIAVLSALAVGFAGALQERTRHELERITVSAFDARASVERERWNSEARFAAVFAESPVGIGVGGIDGVIIDVNKALCRMFGFTAEEFAGRSFYDFVHPDDDPAVWEQMQQMVAGQIEYLRFDKSYFRADGGRISSQLVISLIRDPGGEPRYVVAMVEDVSDRRALEDRLRHQAEHDPLTGLPNRAVFFERLDAALADPAAAVGVCFLDLDGFKAVNDTLGHSVGDELLRVLARRLDAELGPDGHLVARMGGDEFVVLVHDGADRDVLTGVAERALETVRRPVRAGGRDLTVTASVGLVERGDGGASAAELMTAADTTLYWAKNDGRNRRAFFDRERHLADIERFAVAARLPDALERGEFVVEYQPLVRLEDSRMTGVEALVRWRRPGGLVGPDAFVPLAEESGLIVPLGRWVLEQACRQAVRWQDEHRADGVGPMFVSVNVSARQVREPGFVAVVEKILSATGWPARSLQLELTETDVMATTGEPLHVLRELAALGVRIAIDDFGTGYSNLAYLRDLPVHVLKLAGPFVSGTGGAEPDDVAVAVLAHVVRLAHTLGLSVTAEHVETARQVEQLRTLGCDLGQGWHFSPATDPARISEMLRAGSAGRVG